MSEIKCKTLNAVHNVTMNFWL